MTTERALIIIEQYLNEYPVDTLEFQQALRVIRAGFLQLVNSTLDPISQGKSELMRRFAELNNVKVTEFGTKEDFIKKFTDKE
jgi:hypothetical protein